MTEMINQRVIFPNTSTIYIKQLIYQNGFSKVFLVEDIFKLQQYYCMKYISISKENIVMLNLVNKEIFLLVYFYLIFLRTS